MAARSESLEFDFDPLASSEFLGLFIRGLDYEARRQLTARGSGGSGGSGRRGGSRRRQSPQTRIRGVLRSIVQETEKSARAKQRAAEKAAEEAAYERRIRRRGSEIAKAATERAAQLERRYRQDVKAAAASRRALAQFLIAPSRRTPYQRRVVSGVTRQIERGERPSIARALQSKRAYVASLTDAQAIEQTKLRLRQVFPNSENYDNSFADLDYLPEIARALLPLSDNNLWQLIRANPKTANDPASFDQELARLTKQEPLSPPVLVTGNPLFYHDAAARVQYGI
jgi:hypothetical protein